MLAACSSGPSRIVASREGGSEFVGGGAIEAGAAVDALSAAAGGMASGGSSATGGVAASGGEPATGGMVSSGGTSATGGTLSSSAGGGAGGASVTGGIVSSGGVGRSGGAAGGATGSGGTTTALDASVDSITVDAPTILDVAAVEVDSRADQAKGEGDASSGPHSTCVGPASAALANASVPPGYCAWTWSSGLSSPRGIVRNANGDLLVVEAGAGRVALLYDDDGNGVSDSGERVTLTTTAGLNHGIAIHGGYLYASSETTVYRWAYTGGRQSLPSPQTVVSGLPSGGHVTRTLLFDGQGRLYVSVGSGSNVDPNSGRARVIRFAESTLASGSTFAQGELFADGLRNEVGLALDAQGRVWGVENGVDDLNRADLGGDIHTDNPGEELNLFAEPGHFYGYPYCWSEFLLPAGVGLGPRTQWVHPQFMGDGTHTDLWCRDIANVIPPVLVMQAHSAPLDIKFYGGGAFPTEMTGSAIISYHGSWDRTPATGYKVVHVPFGADGMPNGGPVPLLEYSGAGDTGGGWPHRPVGIETGVDGRLFVSSDASGVIVAIGYNGG